MTRISETIVVQMVDFSSVVVMDESTGAEQVYTGSKGIRRLYNLALDAVRDQEETCFLPAQSWDDTRDIVLHGDESFKLLQALYGLLMSALDIPEGNG